jgi:hypothetical protein
MQTTLSSTLGTIVSDGWSDALRRPIVNLLLVTPAGATFLHSTDTSGMTKNAQYIADAVLSGIDKVGHENVLQVITDNAANCKGAWPIITAKYKHICAAHVLLTHLICCLKTGAKYRG